MIRIAAVGDVHAGVDSAGLLRPHMGSLHDEADILLLAGDLTRRGEPKEIAVLCDELAGAGVPVVAVLGNHDYETGQEKAVVDHLEGAGIAVLEGTGVTIDVGGSTLGVAGTKGFGGGFAGASGSDFGEPEMKAFVRHSKDLATGLEHALLDLDADVKVALSHYSPIEATLQGERLEIYPFLGSYFLAEAVDRGGAQLAIHGHAHAGSERGVTPGGVDVRNVAQPVLGRAYAVYCLGDGTATSC